MTPQNMKALTTSLSPSELRSKFIEALSKEGLKDIDFSLISENLLSPAQLVIPRSVLDQIQSFISEIFNLRRSQNYFDFFEKKLHQRGLTDPRNFGIVMSYDFHLDADLQPKLIEINTNASFLALGKVMFDVHEELRAPEALRWDHFSWKDIIADIQTEWDLRGIARRLENIKIVDDNPSSQKLYLEFLLYKLILESRAWNVEIADIRDGSINSADFIYNRHTDFYFDNPESSHLKEAFRNESVCVSPNPFEYFLLADKERLIDWKSPEFFSALTSSQKKTWKEKIDPLLLQVYPVSRENADFLWNRRKNLFFKPRASFGSKQAYKGASISRSAFEQFFTSPSIAQEFCPPCEVDLLINEKTETFKFDLRCYAYQGKLELALARIYQGQTTNLRTPFGGFAPIYVRAHE